MYQKADGSNVIAAVSSDSEGSTLSVLTMPGGTSRLIMQRSSQLGQSCSSGAPPADADGHVYVATCSHGKVLHKLNLSQIEPVKQWTFNGTGGFSSIRSFADPAIDPVSKDAVFVATVEHDNELTSVQYAVYSVQGSDGAAKWRAQVDGFPVVVAVDQDVVLVGGSLTGDFSKEAPGPDAYDTWEEYLLPIHASNVRAGSAWIAALSKGDGSLLWSRFLENAHMVVGVQIDSGKAYVTTKTGGLYALNMTR